MLDFLKTAPAPEAITPVDAPAITEIPKINMSQRIRDYKAANPDATAKQVADAVGATSIYVYQVLGNPPSKTKKEKKPESLLASKNKTDGFAIAVNQPHYWVISALASGRKTTRMAVLQGIIDQYIRDVLTEANQNGSPV